MKFIPKIAQKIPAKYRKVTYVGLAVVLAVTAVLSPSTSDSIAALLGALGFAVAHGNVTIPDEV